MNSGARETFVVVNPKAGNGKVGRRWPDIADRLRAHIGPFDQAHTTGPGHGIALVRQAADAGASLVVAVGGDGTVNEAINGIVGANASRTTDLAVIPTGTGADFARGLGLAGSVDEAIDRIVNGAVRKIDLGRVTFTDPDGRTTCRYFGNVASFGLSGTVVKHIGATAGHRPLPGKAVYLLATIRALMGYRRQRVRLAIDDGNATAHEVAGVVIANGRFFGGGMMIAPDAEPDDGTLDIVIIHSASRGVLLRDLRLVYGGRHKGHPAITILRGRRIVAEAVGDQSVDPILLEADGEWLGALDAAFDVEPAALRLRG